MEVSAIPVWPVAQRLLGEGRVVKGPVEPHIGTPIGGNASTNVGDRKKELPAARRNGSRQIRGCCIRFAESELLLVSAAGSAEPEGVQDTQVDNCMLVLALVVESHCNAVSPLGNVEGDLNIRMILRRMNASM